MEDDLIMNKLPLPKYFDGHQWNTVVRPTRRSIPKYLHEDLPELKHIYIKQKFKEIGKFNCPKLEYFDKMIKNKKPQKVQQKKTTRKKQKVVSYDEIKEQLQYALITTDNQSNIVNGLLEKAKKCVPNKQRSKSQMRHKNRRLSKDTGKYFGNTVDLVFRQRKREYLQKMKQQQQPDTTEMQQRISNIKLISFDQY